MKRSEAGRVGCGVPECGCADPAFTKPMEAIEFLAGRMEHAGISEAVGRYYARDLRAILERSTDNIEQRLEIAEAALRNIAFINAMDYEYQRWAKQALTQIGILESNKRE